MNPYRKEIEPKVKTAVKTDVSIAPVVFLLLIFVIVLLISGAPSGI